MSNVFEVNWTGRYPSLCFGEWIIKYKGDIITLPENLQKAEMKTYGTYSSWHFEDWREVFDDYEDGVGMSSWIKDNDCWISKITNNQEEKEELFLKIQEKDWRHGSCGGCI